MSYIETIPFKYHDRKYVLLVQPKKNISYTDYNVTAVTSDIEAKLYVNFAFRWNGRTMTLLENPSDKNMGTDFIDSLWKTIYNEIILRRGPVK